MQVDCALKTPCLPAARFKHDLLATLPAMRAYAISLCHNNERADDLVQETVVKALAHLDSFEPESNILAWLFTILRNQFYSEYRKRRREVEDDDDRHASLLQIPATQEEHIYFLEVRDAAERLTREHRDALMVIVSGLSYDAAAAMSGCAVGTMKSRVNRARGKLVELLDDRPPEDTDLAPVTGEFAKIDGSADAVAFG